MRGIAFNPLSAREFLFERFYNNIQNLRDTISQHWIKQFTI